MFTDTHFHLSLINELGIDCKKLFTELVSSDFCFLQDIGTRCDDLICRMNLSQDILSKIDDADVRQKAGDMLFFSAGIWPDVQAIKDRTVQMTELKRQIDECKNKKKLIAIGECGLDHHWNINGADHRSEKDFDDNLFAGESELFEMQLELAEKMQMPVIVHSRDAFDGTFACIKNVGYNNGEIHCFSYGKEQAKAFLDLGWYIALGGAVTYTKKSHIDEIKELIRYIPRDRLLVETDSPYLSPVPFRGQVNTPALILNTYQFIADILCVDKNILGKISCDNAESLFFNKIV